MVHLGDCVDDGDRGGNDLIKRNSRYLRYIFKKLQAGKPDSVAGYHLSVPKVTYRDQSAYPSRTIN